VRFRTITLAIWGLALLLCFPAVAKTSHTGRHNGHGGNCVAYARDVTGIDIDGNAWTWWSHAEGRYERGQQPSVGAILVFKPHGRMHLGHVAVVSRIVGPHEILVDHANWVRGRVTTAMSVIDASSDNDWTVVKVLEPHSGKHGRDNPTFGFIYPRPIGHDGDRLVASADPRRLPGPVKTEVALVTSRIDAKDDDKHTALRHGLLSHARAKGVRVLIAAASPHHHARSTGEKLIVFY
jgi:surface antigen